MVMSSYPTHPRLETLFTVTDGLVYVARELALAAAKQLPPPKRHRRGTTLRPGPATPLWNAVVQSVRPLISRWGEKVKLGRILGVPPQRIHEYFVAGTATPDAERTLLVVHWLAQQYGAPKPVAAISRNT